MIKVEGLQIYITLVEDKSFGEIIRGYFEVIDKDGFVVFKSTIDVTNKTALTTFFEGVECFSSIQIRRYKG